MAREECCGLNVDPKNPGAVFKRPATHKMSPRKIDEALFRQGLWSTS